MEFSLLVLTYNREKYLKHTLESLCQQETEGMNFEAVIVDDGSEDNTRQLVREYENRIPRLKYVYHAHQGVRIAECRNLALSSAAGEIVCFVDTGTVLKSDFIRQHYSMHQYKEAPDVVIGRILAFEECIGNQEFEKNFDPDKLQESVRRLEQIEGFEDRRISTYEYFGDTFRNMPTPWHYFWTCNVSWKHTGKFKDIMFDEEITNWGMEDVEFGYRLMEAGGTFEYNPKAVLIHLPHDTQDIVKNKSVQDSRNLMYFYKIHKHPIVEMYAFGRMFVENEYQDYFRKRMQHRLTLEQAEDTGIKHENCLILGGRVFAESEECEQAVLMDYEGDEPTNGVIRCWQGIGADTTFAEKQFRNVVLWDYWNYLNNDLLWCVIQESIRIGEKISILIEVRNSDGEVVLKTAEEQLIHLVNTLLIQKKKYRMKEIKLGSGTQLRYVQTI